MFCLHLRRKIVIELGEFREYELPELSWNQRWKEVYHSFKVLLIIHATYFV